jgi:hypothetical protein
LERLRNYFGGLNEVKAGLPFPEGLEKPEELILYEQIKEMGVPLVSGGVLDQPHIWLIIYGVISSEMKIWESMPGAGNNATSR